MYQCDIYANSTPFRYKSDLQPNKQAASNMRKLLSQCTDLQTTYTLARGLGFTTMVKDMLKTDAAAYLKDTIM